MGAPDVSISFWMVVFGGISVSCEQGEAHYRAISPNVVPIWVNDGAFKRLDEPDPISVLNDSNLCQGYKLVPQNDNRNECVLWVQSSATFST